MAAFTEADRRKILESLTADELETFKEAFTVFDKNQDGTITTKVRSDAKEQNCTHGPFSNSPPLQQSEVPLRTKSSRSANEIYGEAGLCF